MTLSIAPGLDRHRHLTRDRIDARCFHAECAAHRAHRLTGAHTDVDADTNRTQVRKLAGGVRGQPSNPPCCTNVAHRLFVEGGDLEVQIGQVLAAFVDEHPPVQLVVERAQVRQTQRPDHQAGGGRAARAQRNLVLSAELANLVREQQQVRQAAVADGAHFVVGRARRPRVRGCAAPRLRAPLRQGSLDERGQLLLAQLTRRLQPEQQSRSEGLAGPVGELVRTSGSRNVQRSAISTVALQRAGIWPNARHICFGVFRYACERTASTVSVGRS